MESTPRVSARGQSGWQAIKKGRLRAEDAAKAQVYEMPRDQDVTLGPIIAVTMPVLAAQLARILRETTAAPAEPTARHLAVVALVHSGKQVGVCLVTSPTAFTDSQRRSEWRFWPLARGTGSGQTHTFRVAHPDSAAMTPGKVSSPPLMALTAQTSAAITRDAARSMRDYLRTHADPDHHHVLHPQTPSRRKQPLQPGRGEGGARVHGTTRPARR